MADQDPKGPSKGRPKVEVVSLDAIDWDTPLSLLGKPKKRAPSKPSQKRGDGGGSSPAATAEPPEKPTVPEKPMVVTLSDHHFCDLDDLLSNNRSQKASKKPSKPALEPREEPGKPQPKVEVVELCEEDFNFETLLCERLSKKARRDQQQEEAMRTEQIHNDIASQNGLLLDENEQLKNKSSCSKKRTSGSNEKRTNLNWTSYIGYTKMVSYGNCKVKCWTLATRLRMLTTRLSAVGSGKVFGLP